MEAVDVTNRPDYVEAFPGPIQAAIASPPVITLLGLARISRYAGKLFSWSALYALHLEGVEIGRLRQPRERADGENRTG